MFPWPVGQPRAASSGACAAVPPISVASNGAVPGNRGSRRHRLLVVMVTATSRPAPTYGRSPPRPAGERVLSPKGDTCKMRSSVRTSRRTGNGAAGGPAARPRGGTRGEVGEVRDWS